MSSPAKSYPAVPVAVVTCLAAAFLWVILRVGYWTAVQLSPPNFAQASMKAWSFVTFALGVGGLTCALIQMVRSLFPFRGNFHRREMYRWLTALRKDLQARERKSPKVIKRVLEQMAPSRSFISSVRALTEFESRGVTTVQSDIAIRSTAAAKREKKERRARRFDIYDLPIEQLSAQLTLTIDAALAEPRRYPNFCLCLFGAKSTAPLETVLRFADNANVSFSKVNENEALAQNEAVSTLVRLGQSSIDSFQISTGAKWRRSLRLAVLCVSLLCSFALVAGSMLQPKSLTKGLIFSVLVYSVFEGLVAAYLAMVLRDAMAIIENKRRRS